LKKAAELLQQEAAKPPPPQPRVHYEDSEEEEEIEETPERSVTFETPRPTSPRNPLQGRAWANDPYFAKMMARMR
jgi:hypothetical protein